ncbi:transposase-like protein [Nocardia sp. GAS34]
MVLIPAIQPIAKVRTVRIRRIAESSGRAYFPDWLLERRKRAERALTSVVATCYLLSVSTRRMEKIVESLGVTSLSKWQVSMMARDLDAQVEACRTRPLDQGRTSSSLPMRWC